jgi:hypothetical protein
MDERRKFYFEKLAEKYRVALQLHENPGKLWEKDANGKDWRNVTDHCLMEAARAEIFAEKLKFPTDIAIDLANAAALHDFYKKIDVQYTREDIAQGGDGRKGNLRAEREAADILRDAGWSERVIAWIGSVGSEPEVLRRMMEILNREKISEEDAACLCMHYIDDYTVGSEPVVPARDGKNEIDFRAERNAVNPNYQKMNAVLFNGMTRFGAQADVGHRIEEKLSELIFERTGERIEPLQLPEVIDASS